MMHLGNGDMENIPVQPGWKINVTEGVNATISIQALNYQQQHKW